MPTERKRSEYKTEQGPQVNSTLPTGPWQLPRQNTRFHLQQLWHIYLVLICHDVPLLTFIVWVIAIECVTSFPLSHKGTLKNLPCRNHHLLCTDVITGIWNICTGQGLDIQCESIPCIAFISGESNIHTVLSSMWKELHQLVCFLFYGTL